MIANCTWYIRFHLFFENFIDLITCHCLYQCHPFLPVKTLFFADFQELEFFCCQIIFDILGVNLIDKVQEKFWQNPKRYYYQSNDQTNWSLKILIHCICERYPNILWVMDYFYVPFRCRTIISMGHLGFLCVYGTAQCDPYKGYLMPILK